MPITFSLPQTTIWRSEKGFDFDLKPLNENTLNGNDLVEYEGVVYEIGNRMNDLIELYEGRSFFKTVSTKDVFLVKLGLGEQDSLWMKTETK